MSWPTRSPSARSCSDSLPDFSRHCVARPWARGGVMSCLHTAEQGRYVPRIRKAFHLDLSEFHRAWIERRILVFDFAVKGSVVGFNTSHDGTKTFVKIQPLSTNMGQYQRDERPGFLDVLVSPNAIKNLAVS